VSDLKCFPVTHTHTHTHYSDECDPADPISGRDVSLAEASCQCVCGSCTLAVLVGCGLSSVAVSSVSLCSFRLVDSSRPLDRCLLRRALLGTPCCLVVAVLTPPSLSVTPLQPPRLRCLLFLHPSSSLSLFCIAVVFLFL